MGIPSLQWALGGQHKRSVPHILLNLLEHLGSQRQGRAQARMLRPRLPILLLPLTSRAVWGHLPNLKLITTYLHRHGNIPYTPTRPF